MKKISSHKKLFAAAALVALVLVFLPITGPMAPRQTSSSTLLSLQEPSLVSPFSPNVAFADTTQTPNNSFSCDSGLATCTVYFISYLLNKLIGVFVILGAAFTAGILQLNGHLYDSPAVTTGFSITLSFANLGFVLAIIIVAIATILRNQTYGVKQLLWKLVVMAIIVNFGLVVTRPIVGFSDSISGYFVGQMGGSNTGLVTNITNAFGPQAFTSGQPTQSGSGNTNWWAMGGGTVGGVIGAAACIAGGVATAGLVGLLCVAGGFALGYGATVGGQTVNALANGEAFNDVFIQTVIGMITSAIILSIFAFTLMSLAVLLLIRYIYLTVLLILLPLAWLAWVFPGMGSHFQKWWSLFLRWTFFPAISLFFLYLALLIVTNTGGGGQSNYAATSLGINAAQTAAGSATAAAQVGIAEQSLMGIALCGLMLGGLFAANSLGIAGADIAIRYGKSASGWVTGYAGKQGKKAARAGYQKVGGEKINKALQGGRLSRIPVLGRGASLLGRGLASVSTNEKLVEAAKKNVPNDPDAIKQRLKGSMNKEDQFAHVAKLVEMGELKGDESVYGKNIKDFLDSNADAIRRFGQTKPLVVDADKAVGGNKDMRDAERELSVLPQAARAGSEAMRKLETATKKSVEGLSKADVAKMNVNSVFGKFDDKGNLKEPTEVAKALAAGFLKFAPQLTSSLMPKMKSGALGRFKDLYEKAGADEKSDVLSNPQLPQQEKNKRIADIDARLENFGKILENNVLFGGTTPPAAAAPPPANT